MKVLLLSNESATITQKKTMVSKVITTFLALILTLKNLIFDSKFYLPIKGCTIGTKYVPT